MAHDSSSIRHYSRDSRESTTPKALSKSPTRPGGSIHRNWTRQQPVSLYPTSKSKVSSLTDPQYLEIGYSAVLEGDVPIIFPSASPTTMPHPARPIHIPTPFAPIPHVTTENGTYLQGLVAVGCGLYCWCLVAPSHPVALSIHDPSHFGSSELLPSIQIHIN